MNFVIFKPFSETLAGGQRKVVNFYSEILTMLSTTGEEVKVGFGEDQPVEFKAGLSFELPQGERFTRIVLQNDSVAEITVEFILAKGKVSDNRLVIAGSAFETLAAQSEGALSIHSYGNIATTAAAAKLIMDSMASRVGYIIENPITNTDPIFVGYTDGVSATSFSFTLNPGDVAEGDKYRGDIYVFCASVQNIMQTEFI